MALVIDASVATLWFLSDPRSPAANTLVDQHQGPFIAPDFLPVEVANALWFARRGAKTPIHLGPVLEQLAGLIAYESASKLLVTASELARELDHPVYDCIYLALVESGAHTMITADQKLARKLAKTSFAKRVQLLE